MPLTWKDNPKSNPGGTQFCLAFLWDSSKKKIIKVYINQIGFHLNEFYLFCLIKSWIAKALRCVHHKYACFA